MLEYYSNRQDRLNYREVIYNKPAKKFEPAEKDRLKPILVHNTHTLPIETHLLGHNLLGHTYWDTPIGTHLLGHTYWGTPIGTHLLGHTYWDTPIGTHLLGHTYWDTPIGHTYWDTPIGHAYIRIKL